MPDTTPARTCGIRLDEAEELLTEAAGEERGGERLSQPMCFGEMLRDWGQRKGGAVNVTNEASGQQV